MITPIIGSQASRLHAPKVGNPLSDKPDAELTPGRMPALRKNRQRGATLVVSLIMLVVLTLLAVSGIRSSSVNLRIAGNMQMQAEASAAAQQAIEEVISNTNFTLLKPAVKTVDSYTVTFDQPVCQSAKPVTKVDPGLPADGSCLGSTGSPYCYWTTWDIAASAIDPKTGATTKLHQGISVLAGKNAVLQFCGL